MPLIAFDTLDYSNKLQESGMPREQAEAIARANVEAFKSLVVTQQLATKGDIAELRQELKQDIAELRQDMAELRQELKQDIAELKQELKQDMSELRQELKQDIADLRAETKQDINNLDRKIDDVKHELIKWLFGMMVTLGAFIVAYMSYFLTR